MMKRLTASCFGLGRLPGAPGTWGSLPVAIVFGLMCHFHTSEAVTSIVMAALVVAGSVICVKFAPTTIAATGKNDPGEVVADEFAGQALTFLVGPFLAGAFLVAGATWAVALLGFLLFRIFDIFKPWPIRKLEKFPAGWGILADDLLAGVYAGAALLLCGKAGVIEYVSGLLAPGDGSSLGVLPAVVLGIVQGLTEFLPVSSSGHLVLLENLFHFDPETPEMLLFDLILHVGTLAAIFIVFRKSIAALVENLLAWRKYGTTPLDVYRRSPSVHILVLAVLVTGVTGTLGLLLENYFSAARGELMIVAWMWVITGTLLLITDLRKKARLGLRQFGVLAAVGIGLAQTVAILPGVSRSGATICAAILIGLRRRWAVEFSFLIAIPAILGATAVESVKHFAEISSGGLPIGSAAAGAVAAGLTGILALKLLMKTARAANLKYFAFYCYLLAGFVFVYLSR
jgi:undecaprenyl-diphosphatase